MCQKLDENQSSGILSQLLMVNARWERVRENAMARQNLLQQRLNFLQTQQLEEIRFGFFFDKFQIDQIVRIKMFRNVKVT